MRLIFSVIILFLATLVVAGTIPSPGSTGMNSQVDVDAMKPTDAVYLENVNSTDNAGLLQRRAAFFRVGSTSMASFGATGYYHETSRYKQVVGVMSYPVSGGVLGAYGHMTTGDSVYFDFTTSSIGYLMASDTFGSNISNPVPSDSNPNIGFFCGEGDYVDFTHYENSVICGTGKSLPVIYSANTKKYSPLPPRTEYDPRTTIITIPAPGQIRTSVVPNLGTNSIYGDYVYSYVYQGSDRDSVKTSDTSRHSIIVSPRDEWVMLTGFLSRPRQPGDTIATTPGFTCSTGVIVYRKAVTYEDTVTAWVAIAAGKFKFSDAPIFIDSGQTLTWAGDFSDSSLGVIQDTIPIPGQLIQGDSVHANLGNTKGFEYPADSTMKVAWSWYDPVNDIESPLSIYDSGNVSYALAGSEFDPTHWRFPYIDTTIAQASRVRLYRSIHADSGGTPVFYCISEYPVETFTDSLYSQRLLLGLVSDSVLVSGADIWENAVVSISVFSRVVGSDGDIVIRPPVIAPLVIPFSDMDYINGRLWGIGDPLYPQRLYYSGYEDISDWNAVYYLSMDEGENDELVAMEKVEADGGDHILVFKHNSVYDVFGSDPEYDLSISRVTAEYGALSRFGVIKSGNSVYFMDTEKRIHKMPGKDGFWISYPIQDYIDSVFTETDSIRTYELSDRVCFRSIAGTSPKAVVYNKLSGSWSIETANESTELINPSGSFRYDTLQNHTGFDQFSYWLYEAQGSIMVGDGAYLWTEYDENFDSLGSSIYNFPFAYQTAWQGDGDSIYQIQEVRVIAEGDSGQYMICQIYNKDNELLTSDSTMFDDRDYGLYSISLPSHSGMYLSARLSGRVNKIRSLKLDIRSIGYAPTK